MPSPPARHELPTVTLAVPCRNEEHHIEELLRDLLAQDYPAERMEILVGDGMSTDRTREILAEWAKREPRLRVIENPDRIQSAAMNRMIRAARGQVIARFDVHARYATDYLRSCVEVLAETGAANAGGAARARANSPFQEALCVALQSPAAVGGASYRNNDAEGWVDTVFNGAFPRRTFEKAGLYDPKAITNEDAELNQRILASGGRVYLSRRIVTHYFPRESMGALARQYFKYGKGRARTVLKHRTLPTPRPLIPFFMTLTGAAILVASLWQPWLLALLLGYLVPLGLEAARVCLKHGSLGMLPTVWAIFPVLHVSHGVGMAAGLVGYSRQPDWEPGGGAPQLEPVPIPDDPAAWLTAPG